VLTKAHDVAARVEALMVAAVGDKEADRMAALLTCCADRLAEDAAGD
jgi:hypothetical protein